MNFSVWNTSMAGFGKEQKKPSEHSLQDKQFSTSSIPYGEGIATLSCRSLTLLSRWRLELESYERVRSADYHWLGIIVGRYRGEAVPV